jgi:hypothetical protein
VQSVLAGLAVLVLAVGAKYVLNRLWQNSLADDASNAIQAAIDLGLKVCPLGYGAQIRAVGTVDGQSVEVMWLGGALGSRTEILIGDQKTSMALVTTKDQLHDLVMSGEE